LKLRDIGSEFRGDGPQSLAHFRATFRGHALKGCSHPANRGGDAFRRQGVASRTYAFRDGVLQSGANGEKGIGNRARRPNDEDGRDDGGDGGL